MPDEIRMIAALGTAYAVFPSKEAAKKILTVFIDYFFLIYLFVLETSRKFRN